MTKLIRSVFRKEMKDHLRDRRSMASALIFPLMGPAMFGALFSLFASWENSARPLKVPVVGRQNAPNLVAFLERAGAEVIEAASNYEQRVREGDDDVLLIIPEDYGSDFANARPATVQLMEDSSNTKSRRQVNRVRQMLERYRGEMGALRLVARGVSPRLAAAIVVDHIDVATKKQRAANLLNMIPVFLMMATFLGGLHVAIDSMAGERERGSLEPLVLTPASPASLVTGKWLSTVAIAGLGFAMALVGFGVIVRKVPLEDLGVQASLGTREIVGILSAFIPLLFFTAALQILISTFARSFKEAQSYLSFVTLIPMIPGLVLSVSPFRTQWWMALVPTLGQQILASQVMRGEPFRILWFSLAAASAFAGALGCLMITVRLLSQEKIIFGR